MDNSKKELRKAKSNLLLGLKTRFSKPSYIKKLVIPDTWEQFSNTAHKWVKVVMPPPFETEFSQCMFLAAPNTTFEWHTHDEIEQGMIMNKTGSCSYYTEEGLVTLKYGDSFKFESQIPHLFKFNTETLLLLIYHPAFENNSWKGDFIKIE